MSLSSPLEVYFRVDINFLDLATGATTTTIGFTNRPIISSPHTYFPLLRSVSGLGILVDQDGMPGQSTGSIEIVDGYESFGENRRVFDLLERLTAINQSVSCYVSRVAVGEAPSWSLLWSGKVAAVSKSLSDIEQLLTFEVESLKVETRALGKKITSDMVGTPTDIGLGKWLPIPIGESYAQTPVIQATEGTSPYFYMYVQLGNDNSNEHFVRGLGSEVFYARDHEGNYRQVILWDGGALDPDVYVFRSAATGATFATAQDGRVELVYDVKTDQLSNADSTDCYVIHKGRVRIKGQNNGGLTAANCPGQFIIKVYAQSNIDAFEIGGGFGEAGKPEQEIASASIVKADYLASLKGASDFWIDFTLNRPVVMMQDGRDPERSEIQISFRQTDFDTTTTDFVAGGYNNAITKEYAICYKPYTGNQQSDFIDAGTTLDAIYVWELHPLAFTEIKSPASGTDSEGYVSIGMLTDQGTMGTGQVECPINLDLVVATTGLIDDDAGSITGSANAAIMWPDEVFDLLTRTWDGTEWTRPSDIDVSTFSSLYSSVFVTTSEYARKVSAIFGGEMPIDEAIAALCSEHACKVVQLSNGKLALWPWGTTQDVSYVLWDEEIQPIASWKQLGIDSIINKIEIGYYPTLVKERGNESLYGFNGYQGTIRLVPGSDYLATALSSVSLALFGVRETEAKALNTIATETHARVFARYNLSSFDLPHTIATLSLPFWEYREAELMDIVSILSVSMPAYYGTSQNARQFTYEGEEVVPNHGRYLKMAQRYRTHLVGKSISWTHGEEPTLEITARVISPYHPNDPT